MEGKKWIFIEKSLDSVRYSVGESSSMEDSQDYVLCTNSSLPSTYEIIQAEKEEIPCGGGVDTLEIYDDHFGCNSSSSCQTSDMEDSDIEVVLKSPSSSESASLCSHNSNTSHLNGGETCEYKDMIFNVDMISARLNSTNEEEDSEVEVIGRSIHCDKPNEISRVEDMEENAPRSMMLGSENENDDEVEEVGDSFAVEETTLCCEIDESREDRDVSYVEAVEDYGIKYLFEDLQVTRHTCNRMIGLKASTVVLIVCVSATLGLYLGNYFGKSWYVLNHSLDGDEDVVIPSRILHSNKNDPLSVNITFKYSSSTKETLKNVLLSFRQLKQDYDRLHSAYHDMKEKSHVKKQMNLYWRKQVRKMMEHGDSPMNKDLNAIFDENKNDKTINSIVHNNISHSHRSEIRKLSRDLDKQRKTTLYWKKKYNKALPSRQNTCPNDDHHSPFFSFSSCLDIFSKVIPKLDIGTLNITKPVADKMHKAWSKLRKRWNFEEDRKKEDHVDPTKVDRFRQIFVIGNVVNSAQLDDNDVFNDTQVEDDACGDFWYQGHNLTQEKQDDNEILLMNRVPFSNYKRSDEYSNISITFHHPEISEDLDELNWLRNKFKESKFLVDILKWQSKYRRKMDMVKRERTDNFNESLLKSEENEKLFDLERENTELKDKISNNSAYFENIRRRVKHLKVLESKKCNSSIKAIKRTFKRKYRYLVNKVRKEEQKKSKRKVYDLVDRMKRRYNLLLTKAVKSLGRKGNLTKKLQKMKNSLKRDMKREYERLRIRLQDKRKNRMNYHEINDGRKYKKLVHKHGHIKKKRNPDQSHGRRHKIYNERKEDSKRNDENSKFKKKLNGSKKSFQRNNKRGYKNFYPRHGDKRKDKLVHRNRKWYRNEKNRGRQYKEKIREYAKKYQRSIVEITNLRKMYSDAVEETRHAKRMAKEYKDEVEKYKTMIEEYEGKISRLLDSKEERNGNPRQRVETATEAKEHLHGDVYPKTQDVEKPITHEKKKKMKNVMDDVPTGNCYNDAYGKPVYNVNDVYPEDLFSRTVKVKTPPPSVPTSTFSDPKTLSFLPPQQKNIWHMPPTHFVDFSALNQNLIGIYGTNNSDSFPKVASQLHNDEDIAVPNNWYVRLMEEKRKHGGSFEEDITHEGGIWFWKMMKERDKVRSSEDELNWFWKAMKEREKVRSSEEEVNWFWKAMKEREELRT